MCGVFFHLPLFSMKKPEASAVPAAPSPLSGHKGGISPKFHQFHLQICQLYWPTTPSLAGPQVSVPQFEAFLAIQEHSVAGQPTSSKAYYNFGRISRIELFSVISTPSCTCSFSQCCLFLNKHYLYSCNLCWLPALYFCLCSAEDDSTCSWEAPPATRLRGKLTGHCVNARAWTLECTNLITGRQSKQLCATIFSRKLTLLHFHPRSLLNMQQ